MAWGATEQEVKIQELFTSLEAELKKLGRIKESSKAQVILREVTKKLKDAKTLILEFEREARTDGMPARELADRKRRLANQLNEYIILKKQYTSNEQGRNELLAGSAPAGAADSIAGTPQALSMQELMKDGRKNMHEIDSGLTRAEKLVEDTVEIGKNTAATLHDQSQQLNKIVDDLNEIEFTMKKATKIIADIGKGIMTDRCIMFLLFLVVCGVIALSKLNAGRGAFDEACTEFIRVPRHSDHPLPTIKGITAAYDCLELQDVPLAAQLMGSNPELLALAAVRLVTEKGAPRIDLNCGCPASVVTGGGAGSSLLKGPSQLLSIVRTLVDAVGGKVPVTVKMRSGFADTSLFEDNLWAVQEGGAAFVTIHPRTKAQSYSGAADWSLIAQAKQLLDIPVVGNGDVVSVQAALDLLQTTNCDGIMIGRGALQDPFLFHRIRAHFSSKQNYEKAAISHSDSLRDSEIGALNRCGSSGQKVLHTSHQHQQHLQQQQDSSQILQQPEHALMETFLTTYASYGFDGTVAGAEQLVMKYIFSGQPQLRQACHQLLRVQPGQVTADQLLEDILQQVRLHWQDGGPPEHMLVSHFTMPGQCKQTWTAVSGSSS
eukprot:gene8789-8967_t